MIDFSHLDALQLRLYNTKRRAANCERHKSLVWDAQVSQIKKEIEGEYKFLGIQPPVQCTLSEDQLLSELGL